MLTAERSTKETWLQVGYVAAWVLILSIRLPLALVAQEEYPTPPEAERQTDVPEGQVLGPYPFASKIYPGTNRDYWVYVPAQYDPEKAACTLVIQDGLNRAKQWRLPTIMDNLIDAEEMPVTLGIFVSPGVTPAGVTGAQPRFNRSFEYDSLGDRYARFLIEELLPEVAKTYNLSNKPDDRAIAGASSGGVCAFNVAWERPDAFHRVLSTIGTFVGLRGGNELAALVRKTEPKALRIFLQDGSSDLNIYAGDWWTANQDMLSALQWSGYDVRHVWGEGGHNGRHAASIMPDALRWLWRDYPNPVQVASQEPGKRRIELLIPGEDWKELSSGHELACAPTSNAGGDLFFSDAEAGRIYRVDQEQKTRIFSDEEDISGLAFAPDGQLYAIQGENQIVRLGTDGQVHSVVAKSETTGSCCFLTTLLDGFYYVDSSEPAIHWISYSSPGERETTPLSKLYELITPTTDHAFLHLVGQDQLTMSTRVDSERRLVDRQEYGYLEMPYTSGASGAVGVAMDSENRLYVATAVGIQVLDQLGRVNLILRLPSAETVTGMTFTGPGLDVLVITTASTVYHRKLNTRGWLSYMPAQEPPKPQL